MPIVLDNGTGILKIGFAHELKPQCCLPNVIGKPKNGRLCQNQGKSAEANGEVIFFSDDAIRKRGLVSLSHPMSNGFVFDWTGLESVWRYVFSEPLNIDTADHTLLVTETIFNPTSHRCQLSEMIFEKFNFPAVHIACQPILALYASARTTGLVLDSGEGSTSVTPIFDAYCIPGAAKRTPVAGSAITNYFKRIITGIGCRFMTTAEHEVARDMKERICYVALDYEKECHQSQKTYELPDGQQLSFTSEPFEAAELIFKPSIGGYEEKSVPQLVNDVIQKSPVDIRKDLSANIVIAGGTTLLPGFVERLDRDLCQNYMLSPTITAAETRQNSVWLGGSVLASLHHFEDMCVTRQEYEEKGSELVQQRFGFLT